MSSTKGGRRPPLANVPNAVNSPFRHGAAASGKRTRAQAGEQREAMYGQPPAKKQVVEVQSDDGENVDPRKRNGIPVTAQDTLDELFSKRRNAQPTAFERKLVSASEKESAATQRMDKTQKANTESLESIRQWQRHYRRQFPSFVIYFESVPEEVRSKVVRQIQSLGVREEKFFSRAVTHVVTTRSIPPGLNNTSPDEDVNYDTARQSSAQPAALNQVQHKTAGLLDAHLQRRTQTQSTSIGVDPRKVQGSTADILSRARELGIKIWTLEKLQRMLKTILETDTGEQLPTHDDHITASRARPKPAKGADLEQLLRNEKINGPADRDMTVAAQDMCTFRGYYIYIHDMDEKTKPVMVRDYPKPSGREPGKWPQFYLTPAGRCPFVEDPAHTRKLEQQRKEAQAAAKAQEDLAAQRKTRAAAAFESVAAGINAQPRALSERQTNLRRSPRKMVADIKSVTTKPLDPPKAIPPKRQPSAEGMPPLFGSAQQSLRGLPRMFGGEPIASGMQPSNVTSAIRSQVVSSAAMSSTAAGINSRVRDSKEVSALKRKVLERGASVTSSHSMPSSYMNDVRAAINNDNEPPPRAAKRKAQETLGVVYEDDENGGDEPRVKHRKSATRRRRPVERDPKPGYCENCRDKFDDFDEHIQSRMHRKFALTQDNWKELDDLLGQLKRPRKDVAC